MIQPRTMVGGQGGTGVRYRGATVSRRTAPAAAGPDLAAAAIQLRRLRYYRDLLLSGFESTIWPDRSGRTLRRERLALGIDLPELDAVAIWSVRCGDGTLAIPFIDYILARAREAAAHFALWDLDGTLRGGIEALDRAMAMTVTPAAPATLPRLEEVHVPEDAVAGLCGSGGILDRLVEACETLTLAAARHAAPEAS